MAIVYVNATGGSNSYTKEQAANPATPWLTIQKAADNLVAGDTCRVQAGTYIERVTETTSGSSGSYITYVADGAVTIQGGVYLNGSDYIKFIGFEVNQEDDPGSYGYEMFRLDSVDYADILNCNIHHSGSENMTLRSCTNITVRGCTFNHAAAQNAPWPVGTGNALIWIGGTPAQSNMLFEYNSFSYSDDYFNGNGVSVVTDIVIRNNTFGPTYSASGAHLDNVQPNGLWNHLLVESNWDEGNDIGIEDANGGHHMSWVESNAHRYIWRGNVTLSQNSGIGFVAGNNFNVYHNTDKDNSRYISSTVHYYITGATGISAFNNIYDYVVNSSSNVFSDDTDRREYNLFYNTGTVSGTNNVTQDPIFVDGVYPTYDLHLQSGSPARNAATGVTTASSTTSGTSLVVANASPLWDGDTIVIGTNDPVIASVVNHDTNTITLAESQSWTSGDQIYWRGQKDLGAYPYRAGGFTITGTWSLSSGTVTVTPSDTGLVRFVEVFENGVSKGTASSSPYTVSGIGSGTVTVKLYSLYASDTPVVDATSGPQRTLFRP